MSKTNENNMYTGLHWQNEESMISPEYDLNMVDVPYLCQFTGKYVYIYILDNIYTYTYVYI